MTPIASPHIPALWRDAYECLKPAIEHGGEHTERSVFQGLMNGSMILWRNEEAFIVTSWCDYPAGRIAFVMFAGGKNCRKWTVEAADIMTAWAKTIGCKEIRLVGRKGWRRFFPMAEQHILLKRAIHHDAVR